MLREWCFFSRIFGFFLIAPVYAQSLTLAAPKPKLDSMKKISEKVELPKAIRVTRLSPVFEAPSVKSKVLADADPGTVLIAREVSTQGGWLLVEDEDGHRGWMPRNRTNFNLLFVPETEVMPEPQELNQARDKWLESQQATEAPRFKKFRHQLAGQVSSVGWGGSYTFFQLMNPSGSSMRQGAFGVQLGLHNFWGAQEIFETYATYLKFRWLGQDRNTSVVSGPDFGVTMRHPEKKWLATLGYSWGWMSRLEHGGFSLLLRPALELGASSRALIELEAGWFF